MKWKLKEYERFPYKFKTMKMFNFLFDFYKFRIFHFLTSAFHISIVLLKHWNHLYAFGTWDLVTFCLLYYYYYTESNSWFRWVSFVVSTQSLMWKIFIFWFTMCQNNIICLIASTPIGSVRSCSIIKLIKMKERKMNESNSGFFFYFFHRNK